MIAMDFQKYNFEQMEKEWNNNNLIMFEAGDVDNEGKMKSESVIKKNMIAYIYITKLPSGTKESLSRVLLRGEVIDEPHPVHYNEIYLNSKKTDLVGGYSVGNLVTLRKEDLEDNDYFSREFLKEKEVGFNVPQHINTNLSNNLIELLDQGFKSNGNKNDFKTLIDHFNRKCYFCGKIGKKGDHKTFRRRNGTDYYEYHHFIQQCKGRDKKEIEHIVNAPENGIWLCSNCHNKIHYGNVDDVNEMIEVLWQDERIQSMLKRNGFESFTFLNGDPLGWIKSTYYNDNDFAPKENDNV